MESKIKVPEGWKHWTVDEFSNNPLVDFQRLYSKATESNPDACIVFLSTCGKDGQPSSRAVILRHVDEKGFIFDTTSTGKKYAQIQENPKCSMLFYWPQAFPIQVRIEGAAEELPFKQFKKNLTREELLGLHSVKQSATLSSHLEMVQSLEANIAKYQNNQEIPDPPDSVVLRVLPNFIEFQKNGHPYFLNDRIAFSLLDGKWTKAVLAP